MAVKFAVYESLRPLHNRLCGGRQVRTLLWMCYDLSLPGKLQPWVKKRLSL